MGIIGFGHQPVAVMDRHARAWPTLASMSIAELMFAARKLAKETDAASDTACTAVLDELQKRAPGEGFDNFVAEIYS